MQWLICSIQGQLGYLSVKKKGLKKICIIMHSVIQQLCRVKSKSKTSSSPRMSILNLVESTFSLSSQHGCSKYFFFGKMPKTCGLATTSSHSHKVGKKSWENENFHSSRRESKKAKITVKGGLIWEDLFNFVPSSKRKS